MRHELTKTARQAVGRAAAAAAVVWLAAARPSAAARPAAAWPSEDPWADESQEAEAPAQAARAPRPGAGAGAAEPAPPSGANAAAPAAQEPVKVDAAELKYDRERGIVEAIGRAVVTKGNRELHADYIRVDLKIEEAFASGNVTLREGDTVWTGKSLSYNFGKQTGVTTDITGRMGPFHVEAERTEKQADGSLRFEGARVTTCTNAPGHWHYYVSARDATVVPDDYVQARRTVWHFGPVPVMYWPWWRKNLDDDFGYRVRPGYNSRMGAFLLNSYRYRLTPVLRGETHLDYRTRRGVAGGQDFKWRDDLTGRNWFGDLKTYYAADQEPIDDDEDPAADIDESRYRIRLRHTHNITPRDYVLSQADFLSDADMLKDFFRGDYRRSTQPDNFAVYTHQEDWYSVSAGVRGRVNDFFSGVNRVPEAAVDFMRTPILESGVYYEGRTAAAQLERVHAKGSAEEDYSAFRLDSSHMLLRPDKHFGFLTVIPRAGYRGTHYSATRAVETVTETVPLIATNLAVDASGKTNATVVTSTGTRSVTRQREGGATLRNLIELGAETSFKAFKTWEDPDSPRRHIVEPYANWTFVPEPSVTPDELYQFDAVDALDEKHFIRLGARNKYQGKRDNEPYDLIDADTYTILNIHREEDQDVIEHFYFDVETRPARRVAVNVDGRYSLQDSQIEQFNVLTLARPSKRFRGQFEYRYRVDDSSLVSADATFLADRPWSFNLFGRHEFEDGRFEEGGGWIQRTFDCMAVRTGASVMPGFTRDDGSEQDDEYRFIVEFWLTAFPEAGIGNRDNRN